MRVYQMLLLLVAVSGAANLTLLRKCRKRTSFSTETSNSDSAFTTSLMAKVEATNVQTRFKAVSDVGR